jgi:hypothetical protein
MLPPESRADFFKYRDDSGAVVITNQFENVPKRYRSRVKVVWDKDLAAKDPVARQKAAAMEQLERQNAAKKVQQNVEDKMNPAKKEKEKTLVIEFDDNTGQVIRRFE